MEMRTRTVCLVAAFALLLPRVADAQSGTATPATPPAGQADVSKAASTPILGRVDFGVRGDNVAGDPARHNRFRDVRDGAFLDRFRVTKTNDHWLFLGEAINVGYRDQRFAGTYERFGRLKAGFLWDQVPIFITDRAQSLQRDSGDGVLVIDDSIQRSIQDAATATKPTLLTNAINTTQPFDLRSRRHMAVVDLAYTASRDTDIKVNVRNTRRQGTHLQSFLFGNSPGGTPSQELAVPMDNRTTDVEAMVEYANARALLTAGMNASWFDNDIPVLQFDNPLRITDISAGPSRGQAPMWPSNNRVSFVASGTYKLPARTRLLGNVSFGRASQDEELVPSTVNTALVSPSLFRQTADARADIVSMVYGVNSRPADTIWLNARYRYYDYDNKTPHFEARQLVGDWSLGTALWETEPLSVRNHLLDLDASFTPMDYFAFGVGYARRDDRRTFRIYEDTAENTFRLSLDSTGHAYYTIRLKYEYSARSGSGFTPELLEEVGEHPEMRHFDVANRDRTRVTALFTATPVAWLGLNGSVATGKDDYDDTGFGLRDNRNRAYGVGFDVSARETVTLGAAYQREKYTANQYSRTANAAQFEDPTRDWWLDTDDRVDTISAYVDLLKTFSKTDIRVSYDISDGRVTYVYSLKPEQTVFTTTPLHQLAPVTNRMNTLRSDVQYFLRANVALGFGYWFDDYNVDDFSLNGTIINPLNPGNQTTPAAGVATVYTGYLYRPYTAHTISLRATYLW
jgi:MtrB/PioB family decaheme-associated outer membrane protein